MACADPKGPEDASLRGPSRWHPSRPRGLRRRRAPRMLLKIDPRSAPEAVGGSDDVRGRRAPRVPAKSFSISAHAERRKPRARCRSERTPRDAPHLSDATLPTRSSPRRSPSATPESLLKINLRRRLPRCTGTAGTLCTDMYVDVRTDAHVDICTRESGVGGGRAEALEWLAIFFSQHLGARRRRTPSTCADLKVPRGRVSPRPSRWHPPIRSSPRRSPSAYAESLLKIGPVAELRRWSGWPCRSSWRRTRALMMYARTHATC